MRKLFAYIGIFSLTICSLSCQKEEVDPEWAKEYWGEVKVALNGENWDALPVAHAYSEYNDQPELENLVEITFVPYPEKGEPNKSLYFSYIPLAVGRYELAESSMENVFASTANYMEVDWDIVVERYEVTGSDGENYIEIEEYNVETGEIKGTFSVILKDQRERNEHSKLPETIQFTEGSFHTKLKHMRN